MNGNATSKDITCKQVQQVFETKYTTCMKVLPKENCFPEFI